MRGSNTVDKLQFLSLFLYTARNRRAKWSVSLQLCCTCTPLPKQEAFGKCWAHSSLRAAARPFTRCRYCTPPLSHAACASMSTTTTTTTTRDRGDRYGPTEWAKSRTNVTEDSQRWSV